MGWDRIGSEEEEAVGLGEFPEGGCRQDVFKCFMKARMCDTRVHICRGGRMLSQLGAIF